MPSKKPSMIDALRSKHDPHYQLAGKVEGLGKDLPIKVAQLHKTLSKSFVMQRKTLVRVLGLEKRVEELEAAKASVQEEVEQLEEGGEEIPEELDGLIDDVRQDKEVGGTATKTKPKVKKKPKIKINKKKVKGKDIKPKIDAEKFKKGTALDDGYASRVLGEDEKGEYLSKEERIAKFKGKALAKPEDLKPNDKEESSDADSKDIKSEEDIGEDKDKVDRIVKFLNADVKGKFDEINTSVVDIKGVLDTQNQLAEDRDEDMRQALLDSRKSKRESKLEGDDKKGGLKEKLLGQVTKPVEGFLGKLIKFVTMTFVGAIVNRIMGILKDPGQLLDPIKNFFNALIGLVNLVIKGLWLITGAPINLLINGINKGTQNLLKTFNAATGLLKIPPIEVPEIPYIPRPPDIPTIPLSKTAQAKNEGVAMAGGGEVPEVESGMDGEDGIGGAPGESGADGLEGLPGIGGGGGGTDAITAKAKTKSLGSRTKDIGNLFARPFRKEKADPRSQFASGDDQPQGFSGGGYAAPYPTTNLLGMGHNVINTAPNNIMGYNKGGKVPGSGTGDTVPAMLTPGEFVMSKGAVDQIGVDRLKEMNAEGGGTNKPTLMKFAGGGEVPTIDPPSKKSKVIVVGGGGGSKPPGRVSSSGDAGSGAPKFSSTDNNNITVAVIKSIYNIMS